MVELVAYLLWGGALVFLTLIAGSRQGRLAIAGLAGTVASWALAIVVQVAPTIAVSFARSLLTAFRDNTDQWREVAQIFVDELAIGTGTPGAAGPSGVSLANLVNTGPLINTILDSLVPQGALTPEQGGASVTAILGLNVALGLQGWWTELVGDIVSLGRFGAAADLPEAMEKALSINRLGRLIWRTPIQKGISEPLTELYNRRYMFKKLTPQEAARAWHRGQIDDNTFLDYAAAAGYSQDRAAALLEDAKTFYSLGDIRDLWRFENLDDGSLLSLLRELGYTNGRDTGQLQLIKDRDRNTILTELVTQARSAYRQGKIQLSDLESILTEAHFKDDEIALLRTTEDLLRSVSKTLTDTQILEAYKAGALDATDTRLRLEALGFADPDIDLLLSLQHRTLSAAQILNAVTRGQLSTADGVTKLRAEGYSDQDAQLLVSTQGKRLSEGQVIDALRAGVIGQQEATTDLGQLGFAADQIGIILAFLRKTLSPADVQTALLRGLITTDQALQTLVKAGYSQADAQLLVDLRFRLLNVGQIEDTYVDGLITRSDAINDLQQRGFLPDEALDLIVVRELKEAARAARTGKTPPGLPKPPARPPAP